MKLYIYIHIFINIYLKLTRSRQCLDVGYTVRKTEETKFFTSWTSYITGEQNQIYNLILGGNKCMKKNRAE